MSMSVTVLVVEFPCGFQREQFCGLQFQRHVGQLEGDALEFANLLAELLAVHGILHGMFQRAFGAAKAGGCHLQAGGAKPIVGHFETLVHVTEHLRLVHAAIS